MSGRRAKEAKAAEWESKAAQHDKEAKEEARTERECRARLASGKSQDPAADRYLMEQSKRFRRVAEANARDSRTMARETRRWWT